MLLQSVLLAASSYFVVYANAFAAWFVEVQLDTFHHYTPLTLTLVLFIHAILFSGATFASLKKQKFYLLAIFCTLTLILSAIVAIKAQATKESEITSSIQSQTMIGDASMITGLKSGTGDGARAVDGPAAIVGAFITVDLSTAFILFCVALIVAGNDGSKVDAKVGAIYFTVSVAGAALSVWGFTNAIGDSIAKAGTLPLDAARYLANDIALAGAIFMMLGWYLGKRAIEKEESQFLYLRHCSIELNALGGTEFANATLHNCDFSNVDLKYVRFKNARFQGCKFADAKNSHLA